MFKLPIVRFLIVVGLLWPVSAAAQANEEEEEERARANAPNLFDWDGAPLMRISGPVYLQLGVRDKLRGLGNGPGSGADASSGDGSGADTGGGSGGDSSYSGGSGSGNDSGSDDDPVSGAEPGSGDDSDTGDGIQEVPEPALLSLIVPGVYLALRRRAARR